MQYDTGKHCVFYHRYHIVWTTKYRYKVLRGAVQLRVRDIIKQVCREKDVDIIKGVLSSDHVHMFVSVPPKLAISDLVRLMNLRRILALLKLPLLVNLQLSPVWRRRFGPSALRSRLRTGGVCR